MEFIVGLLALTALALLCAALAWGHPVVLKAIALSLYRFARKQEAWQRRQQQALGEAWIRELER